MNMGSDEQPHMRVEAKAAQGEYQLERYQV